MDHIAYENGARYAQQVQKALAQGKSFQETFAPILPALTPSEAASYRDAWLKLKDTDDDALWEYSFWDGYASRWD